MAVHEYALAPRLAAGETVLTAWSNLPDPGLVEALAAGPFGAVTLDMQHGGHHEESVLSGIAPIVRAGKAAVVRIPVARYDMASRALDSGADAIIAPMIDTAADARAFRDSVKYLPVGKRSWGPVCGRALRGVEGGDAFLHRANADTLAFAMIETKGAYEAVEEIAAIDGIDGLFVGPADLTIAWTGGETADFTTGAMEPMLAHLAAVATRAGKHAAIYAGSAAQAARFLKLGYKLVVLASDIAIIEAGQAAFADALSRETAGDA